jgi:hypothetical protein
MALSLPGYARTVPYHAADIGAAICWCSRLIRVAAESGGHKNRCRRPWTMPVADGRRAPYLYPGSGSCKVRWATANVVNIIRRAGSCNIWQRGAGRTSSYAIAASSAVQANDGVAGIAPQSGLAVKVARNGGQTGTGFIRYCMPFDTEEVAQCRGQYRAISCTPKAGANRSPASGALGFVLNTVTGASPA